MSYGNKYNTRNSGRYNTPGTFVSAGEYDQQQQQQQQYQNQNQFNQNQGQFNQNQGQFNQPRNAAIQKPTSAAATPAPPAPPAQPAPPLPADPHSPSNILSANQIKEDVDMKDASETGSATDETTPGGRPSWMKSKLYGVKKISNKERRRRQNENLRRLLTPKNALMVLNEMMPHEQHANQFKVEAAQTTQFQFNKSTKSQSFCADLTVEGVTYKGYGENKITARNAAAEQAIRDLIIKKMTKTLTADVSSTNGSASGEAPPEDEDALPMIQLASYALHKLFSEWEYEGHKVPQLKPTATSVSESASEVSTPAPAPMSARATTKKPKELPLNAASMHPCMLLSFMRPHLEYRDLAVEGDKPQNQIFTIGVEVDGATYVGKASNKKEARKAAARSACAAIFEVQFDEAPTANAPVIAPAPQ